MKARLVTVFAAVAAFAQGQAPERVTVFEGKTAGYKGYRIPALVMTPKGTLLAFCAARKELGDWADIDIVLRRSTDGGKTWEPMRIIAERGSMTVDNPVPIVDRQTGAVHFLFQVNYAQLYYMRSDDDGKTFSTPVDITEAVHNFRRGWAGEGQAGKYGWNVVSLPPGHGRQKRVKRAPRRRPRQAFCSCKRPSLSRRWTRLHDRAAGLGAGVDPMGGDLFVFCSRRAARVKILDTWIATAGPPGSPTTPTCRGRGWPIWPSGWPSASGAISASRTFSSSWCGAASAARARSWTSGTWCYIGRRPWMMRTSTAMTARMSSR